MASAMRVFRKFRSSDGRIKAATAIGVLALASAVAAFGILPALANHEADRTALVEPDPLDFGGGTGACDVVGSEAEHELWINNPKPGMTDYTGPDGTVFTLDVTEDDLYFGFAVEAGSSMGAFDVTVNGGKKSLHYDYHGKLHPVPADDNLHAPTKGANGPLYNLSHVNICYDVRPPADVSGTKYHDRDTDGTLDATEESGLQDWTITAFDTEGVVASTNTGPDGSYTLTLAPGDYLLCEKTNSSNLPDPGTGFTWSWAQSEPSGEATGDCSGKTGYEPLGYDITVDGDQTGLDFGNHRQVSVTCGPDDVTVTLDGASDEPAASVTFRAGCQSGVDGNEPFTTAFDLGLSDDADAWKQFVVFGGDPASTEILEQTIVWAPETANYVDGSLVVPTTQVLLDLGGTVPDDLEDVTFCHELTNDEPTTAVPQCLDGRLIAEGSPLDPGDIQLTENYKLLGDPGNFR